MACLTRNLQKQLRRYIEVNFNRSWRTRPEKLRTELVNKGVCPSDVTVDQMTMIVKSIDD
ncbi:hypothetical protein KIH87_02365 [Paraneptunicella aestuarii]|uniref:hypothetical protein n=1 Tax=Paraneptunicella aestuarii TaxID=2831148 RepID=UPI001E5657CC|nr:hypothetical protein [Paraneptunicella aestuarii]UAA39228.1 hypothetical protein KIH87_02365 [Paraneptunicella aestuarii]